MDQERIAVPLSDPLTGAVESRAATLPEIIGETDLARVKRIVKEVGRTLAAASMILMSAPGATPSTGPNGISRALASRKPTTSAGRGA